MSFIIFEKVILAMGKEAVKIDAKIRFSFYQESTGNEGEGHR